MSLLTKRIIEDLEEAQASRPAPIKLAHRLLDKATFLAIKTTARLSPLTHRFPVSFRDAVHGIPVTLIEWSSSVRANCARDRNMPSLEVLRALALSMRMDNDSPSTSIHPIEPNKFLAKDEIGYHWHIFAENAVTLQFHLLYCDKVNSAWEAFRELWAEKYFTKGESGRMLALEGSLATAISDAAMNSVMVAGCASEGFLRHQRLLVAKDPGERELLERLKDMYGAPNIAVAWADELPDGFVEAAYGTST